MNKDEYKRIKELETSRYSLYHQLYLEEVGNRSNNFCQLFEYIQMCNEIEKKHLANLYPNDFLRDLYVKNKEIPDTEALLMGKDTIINKACMNRILTDDLMTQFFMDFDMPKEVKMQLYAIHIQGQEFLKNAMKNNIELMNAVYLDFLNIVLVLLQDTHIFSFIQKKYEIIFIEPILENSMLQKTEFHSLIDYNMDSQIVSLFTLNFAVKFLNNEYYCLLENKNEKKDVKLLRTYYIRSIYFLLSNESLEEIDYRFQELLNQPNTFSKEGINLIIDTFHKIKKDREKYPRLIRK